MLARAYRRYRLPEAGGVLCAGKGLGEAVLKRTQP